MKLSHALVTLSLSFVSLLPASQAEIPREIRVNSELTRGGQPTELRDFEKLKADGIKTVINLRDDARPWEKVAVESLGMTYKAYPIDPFGYPREAQMKQIEADLLNPELQPVFVHCQHGKDRTGLVVALYRVHREGWDAQRAYDEMLSLGFFRSLNGLKRYFWDHAL